VRYDLWGTGAVDALTRRDLEYRVQSVDAEIDLGIDGFSAGLLLASRMPALVLARSARDGLSRGHVGDHRGGRG